MTFAEMIGEVKGYGFDYEPTDRIERWLQIAYQKLNNEQVWPWSEASKEGKAPLEIKDVSRVLSVTDSTQERPLWGVKRQWLLENFPKLDEEGNPVWWFLDNLTLRTFPLSEDNVVVRYASKAPELKAEDEGLVPEEWQSLVVELAVIEGYKRNSNIAAASEMKEIVDEGINDMIGDVLQRDLQSAPLVTRTGLPWDYL